MPALQRPQNPPSIERLPCTARLVRECDVLVVGGGPAGIGAAMGAAHAGASVVLAERYGFLGGWATCALVMPLASYHAVELAAAQPGDTSMFPSDAGAGEPVIRGVLEDLVERLVQAGGAMPPSRKTGYVVPFDAEVLKWVAQDMLDEAGVEVLHHALAVGALVEDGASAGATFATKSGLLSIRAKATVDCTGDGDVAALAGAPYEVGRSEDGLVQPMTLMFRMAKFDRAAFAAYVDKNPGQWFGVFGLWDLAITAFQAGEYRAPREDVLLFGTTRDDEITVNCTRVTEVLGIDAWDLSAAEIEGRRQVREVASFLTRRVPGFEHAYVAQSGTQIGVRETRRVIGAHVLSVDEVLGAERFDDVVARNAYPVDIHNPQGRGTHLRRLPPCEAYDIPLRCLIPLSPDGLLVAGRCISASHEALSSVRVMPACVATGHAAGVCAALSSRDGIDPRDVPYRDVQLELARQGAQIRGLP